MSIEAMKQALESLSYVMSHGVAVRQAKDILTAAIEQAERNDGIELKSIEHPVSLGDASDYKFSNESIEEGWLQREWVGLTDEDISELWGEPLDCMYSGHYDAIRAIEAKLKEKNGG